MGFFSDLEKETKKTKKNVEEEVVPSIGIAEEVEADNEELEETVAEEAVEEEEIIEDDDEQDEADVPSNKLVPQPEESEHKKLHLISEEPAPAEELTAEAYQTEPVPTGNNALPEIETPFGTVSHTREEILDETATITPAMNITGDMVTQGSLDLQGCITGNVDVYGKLNITGKIKGSSQASEIYAEGATMLGDVKASGELKLGAGSVIVGDVTVRTAFISGAVKGNIDASESVVLDATAVVLGDIRSKLIQVNTGAAIEGRIEQLYAKVSPSAFFSQFAG